MARNVEGARPGSIRSYIPEAFDNRQDPTPVTVEYEEPTENGKRRILDIMNSQLDVKVYGEDDIEMKSRGGGMFDWHLEACRLYVRRVLNYAVRGIPITTGAELAEHGETEIVTEVASRILAGHRLSDDEKKASGGSPDSTSQETQASVTSGTMTPPPQQGGTVVVDQVA